jgi:hypothetical protein
MLEQYHWFWYFLGFLCIPRITIMIFLSNCVHGLPVWFMILGWVFAICCDITVNSKAAQSKG